MPLPISDEAAEDIHSIWSFIAPKNLDAADRLLRHFRQSIEQLMKWPGTGHIRRDIQRNVRFWPVGSYLIVYREKPFLVIAVLHGSRDIRSILKTR